MTDKGRHFGFICDGEIEIVTMTKADVEESLLVLDSFFVKENVCIGCEINLPEATQAREDLKELCRIVAKDRVSLVAKQVATNKIVAVAFNKIQYIDDTVQVSFFEEFRDKQCQSPNSVCLMDYMVTMDKEIDVFEMYQIDCVNEIMFLSTLPEFERRGIASSLCRYSIDLTRELQAGAGVDAIDPSLMDKRPQAVCALFTSLYSQKVGLKNGFQVLNRAPYNKFEFNGKTFDQRIGPVHPDGVQTIFTLN